MTRSFAAESLQTAIDHTMREIVVEGKPPAETIAALTETVGHSADEPADQL